MSSVCSTPKERPFGTWKCKQIGCKELQKDPQYESSPMRCTVLNTIPGNCHCCVKDLDPAAFIRVARGMIYNGLTNFNGPQPGIKNCPAECPYKLVDKKDNGKGKIVTTCRCAFHGDDIKAWPLCPCDVLGNPRQEDQIKRLQIIVSARLKNTNPTIGLCNMGICPDGKNRGGPNTDDDLCPVIRLPFDEINIGMGCPLWRIPAKVLPKTVTIVEKKAPISVLEQPKTDTKGEPASRKITLKKKKECIFRQVTLFWFSSRKRKAAVVISKRPPDAGTGGSKQPVQEGSCGTCGHHKGRKTFHETCPRLKELLFKGGTKSARVLMEETSGTKCKHWTSKSDPRCNICESSKTCNTHNPEKELCVARSLNVPQRKIKQVHK